MADTLTVNDLESRHLSVETTADNGSNDAVVSGAVKIFGLAVTAASSGIATIAINDALTVAAGGNTIHLNAAADQTEQFRWPKGLTFSTGISSSITQAGATADPQGVVISYMQ